MTTVRGRRMAAADRMWGRDMFVAAIGPLPVPPRGDLVAAVRRLAELADRTRLGWVPDHASGRWEVVTDLDELADAAVRSVPEIPGEGLAELLVRVARGAYGAPPISVWICGDTVLLAAAHAVGDGAHMIRLLAATVRTALDGAVPESVLRPSTRHALPRALWAQFGRHPANVVRLFRAVRTRGGTEPPTRSVDESDWSATLTCRTAVSTTDVLRELKAWRSQHASGLSTIPLAVAAAELARRRHGVATAADPMMAFDLRRFVHPGGADVWGNFSVGMRLQADDTGDPHQVHEALRRHVALGRPLAVLGAAALRRGRAGPPTRASGGAWDLSYVHLGRAREIARLPWRDPSAAFFNGLEPPNGPGGVTIAMCEVGGRLNMSASFHESVVDAQQVEAVLDSLSTEPVALLEEHRVGHGS